MKNQNNIIENMKKNSFKNYMKQQIDNIKTETDNIKKVIEKYRKIGLKDRLKEAKQVTAGNINTSKAEQIQRVQANIKTILAVLIIISCVYAHYGFSITSGNSMYPTIQDGNILLYKRDISDLKVGDIVVVKTTKEMNSAGDYVVKRVSVITDKTVYLLGDNEANSKDSRTYGYVNKKNIEGKVLNYD